MELLPGQGHPFLQLRVGDFEHLHVSVHLLLGHLLEVVLLLVDLLWALLHLAKPFPRAPSGACTPLFVLSVSALSFLS
jgi:hypothetical protein